MTFTFGNSHFPFILILILKVPTTYVDKKNMLNVHMRVLSYLILLATAILTGCKEPEVAVSSLGKKLSAPVMKGTSPFSQPFDTQGYARIEGACDKRIGNLSLSFDKTHWHLVPATPDVTDTSLVAATVNDINCADGSFDIYLTKNDLQNIWGINPGSDSGSQDDIIYIKGETLIGDSDILAIVNSSPGGGSGGGGGTGGSPDTVAAKLTLEKSWPNGFAGAGQCEVFRANLVNAAGYRGATASSPVTFSVEAKDSSENLRSFAAFDNWSDCTNGINQKSNFTIPAGADGVDFIYRFPGESPLINTALFFRIKNPSLLVADTTFISVTLRDALTTSYRFLTGKNLLHQIYKDRCYPLTLVSNRYSTRLPAGDSAGGTLSFTTNDPNFKLYTTSSCDSQTTSYSFAPGSSELPMFVKYTSGADTSTSYKQVSLALTTPSASGGASLQYDFLPLGFNVDLTASNLATKMDLWGPYTLDRNSCHAFNLITLNNNGTPLPVSTATNIAVGTVEASVGTFHSSTDSSCASYPISSVSMPAGSYSSIVYFKPTIGFANKYSLKLNAANFTSPFREIQVQLAPTLLAVSISDLSLSANTLCKPVVVNLSDDLNQTFIVNYNISTTVSLSVNGSSRRFFNDSACATGETTSGYVVIPAGSNTWTGYVSLESAGIGVGDSITATVNPTGNLQGSSFSGTISN